MTVTLNIGIIGPGEYYEINVYLQKEDKQYIN